VTLTETIRAAYPDHFRADTPPGGCTARIDDRGPDDYFWAFCEITVTVHPDETMTLTLSFPPLNDVVRTVVDDYSGRVTSQPTPAIVLDLPAADDAAAAVRDLAAAIKGVTRRGQRYPEKNWKWIAPRTANALKHFAGVLAAAARPRTRQRIPQA
jgi:hypothetical protein